MPSKLKPPPGEVGTAASGVAPPTAAASSRPANSDTLSAWLSLRYSCSLESSEYTVPPMYSVAPAVVGTR